MECPYCVSEIDDHALVCRHCQRDLAFFRPLLLRLSHLEQQVLCLTDLVQDRSASSALPDTGRWLTVRTGVTCAIVAAGASLASVILFGATAPPLDVWFLWLPDAAFWAVGVWLGITMRGRRQGTYLWCGALMGLTHLLTQAAFLRAVHDVATPLAFCASVIEGMLFATFGSLLGDWLEVRRHPETATEGFTGDLARRVVQFRLLHQRSSPTDIPRSIRRWSEAFQGFAPILSLIGTIAMLYLGQSPSERRGLEQVKQPSVAAAQE